MKLTTHICTYVVQVTDVCHYIAFSPYALICKHTDSCIRPFKDTL